MMLSSFHELPKEAKRLIYYYSLSSIPLVAEIFLPIYFYMLHWSLVEIGLLYTVAGVGNFVGSILIGNLFDRGFQPKWAMAAIDFVSGFALLMLVIVKSPLEASLILFIEYLFYPFASAYQTLEKEVYPEDKLESTFSFHMLLPNASQIPGFLFIGVYLTFIKRGVEGFRHVLIWGASLFFLSAFYIVFFIPKTRKHKFQGFKFSRIPRRLLGFALAEIIIVFAYSIVPEFVFLNIVYNISSFTVFEIALTRIPADLAGVVGAILSNKFKSNKLGIMFSLPLIGFFHIIVFSLAFNLPHIVELIVISVYTFASYAFHTVWFIHHRSIFFRDTPDDLKGTIFGIMMSSRLLVNTIAVPVATFIANFNPYANFIVAGIIMISVLPLYAPVPENPNN